MIDQNLHQFFCDEVAPFFIGRKKLKFLEIGVGVRSLFGEFVRDDFEIENLVSIDIDEQAINQAMLFAHPEYPHQFLSQDYLTMLPNSWDLLMDGHCFHCLTSAQDRLRYLDQTRRGLEDDGLWALECMVQASALPQDFDLKNSLLWRGDRPFRYLPRARELEQLILDSGFEILRFHIVSGAKFIPFSERSQAISSDPDCLRLIAKKKA